MGNDEPPVHEGIYCSLALKEVIDSSSEKLQMLGE